LLIYSLGVLLGLLPTVLWIFYHGLLSAFYFDVFSLNSALSKPWDTSLNFLLIPICLASALGMLLQLGTCRRGLRLANGPIVMALALAAGFALAFLARHPARYNMQILMVPIAVGFVSFLFSLCLHIRGHGYQMLLCVALLGYPTLSVTSTLLTLKLDTGLTSQQELQMIVDLARPGNRTCIAFSPDHPIFCHDISGLSNGWDLTFAETIKDPLQIERFRSLWHDGIRQTLDRHPDIILRRSPRKCWERAVDAGLVTQDQLEALDTLGSVYDVRHIGNREVWIKRAAFIQRVQL
jgi:hypothetical protein